MPDELPNTDQRFSEMQAAIAAMRSQQDAVIGALQGLQGLISNNNRPKEEPIPQVTGTEFLDNPAGIISNLVERSVGKLKNDLDSQMRPFAEFMTKNERRDIAARYIEIMEGNASYAHIKNPVIRRMVTEAILTAPQVNDQFVNAVYLTAVGQAFTSGQLGKEETPKGEEKKDEKLIPAHLRPTANSSTSADPSNLPELDENQKRIMRERKWSHARTCYMMQLISADTYKKYEPEGKLVDF